MLVRIGYGAIEMRRPDLVSQLVGQGRLDHRAATVVQVLGGRHLVQAAICGLHPTATTLRLGAGVDVLHAASMAVLAVIDPKYRRVATSEALTAAAFAAAGLTAARLARARAATGHSRPTFGDLMNPGS